MSVSLLITPLAQGAYFAQTPEVAEAELRSLHPDASVTLEQTHTLTWLHTDLEPSRALARRSFVQAQFVDGSHVDLDPEWALPAGVVSGAKYKGKTNELVTQMALNLALDHLGDLPPTLLDPMAGRGTTLLWAARHGIEAWGVEQDPRARDDLERHVKRQAKLERFKHKHSAGSVGPRRKDDGGRFVDFRLGERGIRLVTGDSAEQVPQLGKYTLAVTDLPYGVQFTGKGRRNPLDELARCAPSWFAALQPGGVMVLVFNRLQPRRGTLTRTFEAVGFEALPFSAPHRMSESIERDFLVLRRPVAGGG